MGSLRLVLALLVAVSHLASFTHFKDGGWFVGHAMFAVRAFFVLSGFYMALVLTDRYPTAFRFYEARATRLLPLY
jgi:peptidoglycan/LPS O-acetylase OafA/YrhL